MFRRPKESVKQEMAIRSRSYSCSGCSFTSTVELRNYSLSRPRRRSISSNSHGNTSSIARDVPAPTVKIPEEEVNHIEHARLIEWKDLALWRKEGSSHIQTGYRQGTDSVSECYKSWTYLHNETVNIYSHVIGAFLFACFPAWLFVAEIPPRYNQATSADLAVFFLYFCGVSICFVFSVTFHTVLYHSPRVYRLGAQLDFQGILLLMWSANIALIYYGFYCDLPLRRSYWILHSSLSIACSIITFQPHFSDPHLIHLRVLVFGSFGLSTLLPVFHAIVRCGWTIQAERMGLNWVLLTLLFNTSGAAAYALKFPEKWWVGTFDLFGASHQIFHLAVIFAGLTFTMALLQAFDFLHSHGDTCKISP